MWFQAGLISRNIKRGTAEVVVIIGGRSSTRHLIQRNGKWVGRNPDEAALGNLVVAERVETKAVESFEKYNTTFEATKARVEFFKETKKLAKEKGVILDPRDVARIERGLRVDLNNIAPFVASAGYAMKIAKESAAALRKTTPMEVKFVF